ncbi:DegT/DnrJ/EryC1/StrS family aminotransferase [Catellatospora paridis]|uniref:DegT/DnrJ/EryC1/StrS family aminotransferase n=1 Tax=Catellatospora paridis TaxID=1617086 RepID=UPI0012D4878E|nr:DegT/DnrJ/EryC1/StrS family aminotransferase [Catellatospora paridis]
MNNIPLTRPSVGDAELAAVADVFESGWLAGQGPRSATLEEGFKELTGQEHAIALNNCTAGLHLALMALGVGPGDEVIVSDYSFPATGHAVLYCGAKPVFADVRADTATIDPAVVEALITPNTRGIIAVDALGIPADWTELEAIAAKHGLFLVEDAACSAGGTYAGRPTGSFGDVAIFSLHARKGITSGEGGVLTTNNAELAARVRAASCFGMQSAFARQNSDKLTIPTFPEIGYNYKLSDVLAAIAVVQLSRLDEFTKARRSVAARYAELLADVPGVHAPVVPEDREPTWQTYAITVDDHIDRDALIMGLRAQGIGSNIGTYAMHLQPVYGTTNPCPVSKRVFERQVALPMFPELSEEDQLRVVSVVRDLAR